MMEQRLSKLSRQSTKKLKWYNWLIFLLLPVAMSMPMNGAFLQLKLVGRETMCCYHEELAQSTLDAQQKRPLSNLIMGGSLMLGIVFVALFCLLFWRCIWWKLGKTGRIISGVVVGLLVVAILVFLVRLLVWYCFNADFYHGANGSSSAWDAWPFV